MLVRASILTTEPSGVYAVSPDYWLYLKDTTRLEPLWLGSARAPHVHANWIAFVVHLSWEEEGNYENEE